MKKISRIITTLLLTAVMAVTGCSRNIKKYSRVVIRVNDEVKLPVENISRLLKAPVDIKNGSGTIEIIIYSYSSGAEIIKYSDREGFRQSYTSGSVKAMIKFKKLNRVKDVVFTSADGKNSDEIIIKLAEKINRILNSR